MIERALVNCISTYELLSPNDFTLRAAPLAQKKVRKAETKDVPERYLNNENKMALLSKLRREKSWKWHFGL